MISSYITPSKRQFNAELEAKFQEFFAQGNEPHYFKNGESGGTTVFSLPNSLPRLQTQGNKKPTEVGHSRSVASTTFQIQQADQVIINEN